MTPRPLGRLRDAETDRAVELYPFEAEPPATVERTLSLPAWLPSHDQGREGSCVGHAVSLERAIVNTKQLAGHGFRRYDPIAIWRAAKAIDEYPSTHPEDDRGTSVRAAYEIARTVGLERVRRMELRDGRPQPIGKQPRGPELVLLEGIERYEWARTVDAIRAAIASGAPVAIGVNWYTTFDTPTARGREHWLPAPVAANGGKIPGQIRGGHSVTLAGASDRRQAFRLVNSWGAGYPLVWIPYATMGALLTARGEAALVVDRATA